MNKGMFWFAIGLGTGIPIGSIIGYFWTKNKLEEIADAERTAEDEAVKNAKEALEKVAEEAHATYRPEVSKDPTNYTAYFDDAREEAAEKVEEPDFELQDTVRENIANEIGSAVVVDEDTFGEKRDYDIQDWTYYTVDDVYVNEQEEVVENASYFIGNSINVKEFEEYGDPKILLVNDKLCTYYQITKVFGAFSD